MLALVSQEIPTYLVADQPLYFNALLKAEHRRTSTHVQLKDVYTAHASLIIHTHTQTHTLKLKPELFPEGEARLHPDYEGGRKRCRAAAVNRKVEEW